MDPVSQAFLGAAAAQSLPKSVQKNSLWLTLSVGALGGLAPDLDVLISSSSDSLLHIEYHRHFTHSLFFVPLIGLFVASVLYPVFKSHLLFKQIFIYATVGALTHGFLDACTSYGTHLFWPLLSSRESWNIISIIDPLFTIPLVFACFFSAKKNSVYIARAGLLWCFIYLSFGVLQYHRAKTFYAETLDTLGYEVERDHILVKPTLANLWVWRGVAVLEGGYRVDGLRLSFFDNHDVYPGQYIEKFTSQGVWAPYQNKGQVWKDIKRFEFFSEGLIYQVPERPELVGDLRYSLLPHSIQPLWVVELTPEQSYEKGLEFYHTRDVTKEKRELFIKMLKGEAISKEVLGKY